MKSIFLAFVFFIPLGTVNSQTRTDSIMNKAFLNARKGIYWCLSNIPENKSRLSHELISGDNLIAEVKLEVEVNGIRLISTGFENTAEVSITIYKSVDNLTKEGYLKNKRIRQPGEN